MVLYYMSDCKLSLLFWIHLYKSYNKCNFEEVIEFKYSYLSAFITQCIEKGLWIVFKLLFLDYLEEFYVYLQLFSRIYLSFHKCY